MVDILEVECEGQIGLPLADAHKQVHPSEILREEYLRPAGITPGELAVSMSVAVKVIDDIVRGIRSIDVDTALRLALAVGTSEGFWMNLQNRYDTEFAR